MRFLPLSLLLLTACGVDGVGSNGELGHLSFALSSDWYLDESDITAVGIVTRHSQSLAVDLTGRGDDLARGDADDIEYAMEPADGVVIEQSGPVDEEIDNPGAPTLNVMVTEPGSYTLLAMLHGEVFDRIQLTFESPTELDLALYARAPWTEDFEPIEGSGPTQMREGTQLAWLPIPLDGDGVRLAGDIAARMSADPEELVVPADNVSHVNEDEVYDAEDVPSLYFVEEGEVTVLITDTANPAFGTHAFTVVPG